MHPKYDLSIVIPLLDEEDSLPELTNWIDNVCTKNNISYEIIMIDDGSKDNSWQIIQELSKKFNIQALRFRRNYGKSAALNEGFGITNGKIVMTMDADLQDSPEEIPGFIKMINEDKYDLVSGWKKKRYDPISKTIPTKLYNGVTNIFTGIKLHDMNCGIKAYRYEVTKSIEVYGEMHRYIPIIAKSAGFPNIGEKIVQHQERKYGKSKFGVDRFIKGFLDLFTILFISRFNKKPMHFFGTIGSIFFFFSLIILVILGVNKLLVNPSFVNLANTSYFYILLTFMIIGSQLFLTGFIAELVSRNSTERNKYIIQDEILQDKN